MDGPIPLLHLLSDLEPGGAQSCLLDFVARLDRSRFSPHVCALRKGGALVERLHDLQIPFYLCRFGTRLSPWGLWRLRSLMKKLRIGIVHTHLRRANHAGRLAAVWAKVPVIVAHHHDTLVETKWRQKMLTRWLAQRSAAILCVSQAVYDARLRAGDEPVEKLRIFHNFIDPADYRSEVDPLTMRGELGLPSEGPIVGIVGRLHPLKNHSLFLHAARILLDRIATQRSFLTRLSFVIVGDGILRHELEEEQHRLGLEDSVFFTGLRLDMPRVYRALDLLVLCSIQEGFPKVLLEAQACGVPVVVTPIPGVEEIVGEGSGIVAASATAEALADAVEEALRSEVRSHLLHHAQLNLARFDATRQVAALEALYQDLWNHRQ